MSKSERTRHQKKERRYDRQSRSSDDFSKREDFFPSFRYFLVENFMAFRPIVEENVFSSARNQVHDQKSFFPPAAKEEIEENRSLQKWNKSRLLLFLLLRSMLNWIPPSSLHGPPGARKNKLSRDAASFSARGGGVGSEGVGNAEEAAEPIANALIVSPIRISASEETTFTSLRRVFCLVRPVGRRRRRTRARQNNERGNNFKFEFREEETAFLVRLGVKNRIKRGLMIWWVSAVASST